MMLKKIGFAVAALALLLAAASYFSPHWTIHQMRNAIEKRDYDAFSDYVDFPALRESFKSQTIAALNERRRRRDEGDPLAMLGRGITVSLAGPMLEIIITPPGVIEMMNAGKPEITQAVMTVAITRVPSAAESIPGMQVRYRGWDRAVFRGAGLPDDAGSFVLRRHGLWSWRLAAVEMQRQADAGEGS